MSNIVLTGFMATGKTTIGQLVAYELGRSFVDTDALIVAQAGQSIPQIFATKGEAAFRALEAQTTQYLAAQTELVIATGGGMLVNGDNLAVLSASGCVICLTATPETIAERIQAEDGRPLAGQWRELYAARQSAYAAMPHHVATDDRNPNVIAQEVINTWRQSL
jgi:shikimate kinase